jgi:uncharacterized protein YodC (DUF2158 family)
LKINIFSIWKLNSQSIRQTAGDVVRLKSGSEKMSVAQVNDPQHVVCIWYCKATSHIESNVFPAAILQKEGT